MLQVGSMDVDFFWVHYRISFELQRDKYWRWLMKFAKKMVALTLLMIPALAVAQLQASEKIVAQVPFRFMVANKFVPAGECILQRADTIGRTLIVRNVAAKVSLFSTAAPGKSGKASSEYALVFNKYGDRYFLSGLKIAGSSTVYELPVNREELELRAQNAVPTQQILRASLK
jgi:hypothetical protein